LRLSKLRSPYWLFLVLLLGLAGLQYRLWVGDGSLAQVRELEKQIADQQGENQRLLERNRILEAEVAELKKGTETVEERARHELGMVKDKETLYQLAQ
jgi:cell division protein FtsB